METVTPVAALKQFVAEHNTQAEAAEALGIKQAYLSDMLSLRRNISDNILAKLGLKKVFVRK